MPFFDLIIRWVELSDFGPKSDDLGQRIHKSDVIPSDFGKLDCVSRPTFFSVRKIKIRSLESDRIINGLRMTKSGVEKRRFRFMTRNDIYLVGNTIGN